MGVQTLRTQDTSDQFVTVHKTLALVPKCPDIGTGPDTSVPTVPDVLYKY